MYTHYALRPNVLPPRAWVGFLRSFRASTALEILSMSVSRTRPDPDITSDRIVWHSGKLNIYCYFRLRKNIPDPVHIHLGMNDLDFQRIPIYKHMLQSWIPVSNPVSQAHSRFLQLQRQSITSRSVDRWFGHHRLLAFCFLRGSCMHLVVACLLVRIFLRWGAVVDEE